MAITPDEIVRRLQCPQCGKSVELAGTRIACPEGHAMSIQAGYIDAANGSLDEWTARTMRSFAYEWNTFDQIYPEDEHFWARYFADVDLDELAGRVGLDAGCGKGRYTRFTAPHLKAMAALDGSQAVEAAARNLADIPGVAVVKADLRSAPFAPHSFDFVSCLGVLHHLAEPRQGLKCLVELLSPGGILLLYLYSRPREAGSRALGLSVASALRRVTVKLPHRALRYLSVPVAAVLFGLAKVLRQGAALSGGARSPTPLSAYRGKPFRALWLDTFDRLSAPIEYRFTWDELEPWFAHEGLEVEAVREEHGLFIVARKPPARP